MAIEAVPYGNAAINYTNQSVTCQHGPQECSANSYEQCGIYLYPDQVRIVLRSPRSSSFVRRGDGVREDIPTFDANHRSSCCCPSRASLGLSERLVPVLRLSRVQGQRRGRRRRRGHCGGRSVRDRSRDGPGADPRLPRQRDARLAAPRGRGRRDAGEPHVRRLSLLSSRSLVYVPPCFSTPPPPCGRFRGGGGGGHKASTEPPASEARRRPFSARSTHGRRAVNTARAPSVGSRRAQVHALGRRRRQPTQPPGPAQARRLRRLHWHAAGRVPRRVRRPRSLGGRGRGGSRGVRPRVRRPPLRGLRPKQNGALRPSARPTMAGRGVAHRRLIRSAGGRARPRRFGWRRELSREGEQGCLPRANGGKRKRRNERCDGHDGTPAETDARDMPIASSRGPERAPKKATRRAPIRPAPAPPIAQPP